jgi:hypothetical protein
MDKERYVMTPKLRKILASLISAFALAALLVAPAGAIIEAEEAFRNTRARADQPVAEGIVDRTWMWGPQPISGLIGEAYREHPVGERPVMYWDKSRMEINDPNADRASPWYVTNGLLARELMTGMMQFGHTHFIQYDPAQVHVAGDPDEAAPTYATFGALMDHGGIGSVPPGPITMTVDRDGNIGTEDALAQYDVTRVEYRAETDHFVASVFWDFMTAEGVIWTGTAFEVGEYATDALFRDPFYAVGLPLTEAFWTYVSVNGDMQWVLVQAFERRVMTYTPWNPEGWQVEAGNVGQHYYIWRYGEEPPGFPQW